MSCAEALSQMAGKLRSRAAEDARMDRLAYRVRILPIQLEKAREKVRRLEREALELDMPYLLVKPQ